MVAAGYVHYTSLTPEQMNEMNEKATANLKEAYPNATDYDNQVNIIYNLEKDLLAGKDIDWSKYSGKALYAVLKGVVDVVWPYQGEPQNTDYPLSHCYLGSSGKYQLWFYSSYWGSDWEKWPPKFMYLSKVETQCEYSISFKWSSSYYDAGTFALYDLSVSKWLTVSGNLYDSMQKYEVCRVHEQKCNVTSDVINRILGGIPSNVQKVPNLTAKTATKVKLPTRLPQTVINNITNYIDGSSENLIVNPTADELPQLPDNYDPTTDELPDLPGYADVTPDQEPTDDPTPTPTPPDPTPTPPEYDGSGWVNPIGNFLAGLLEFLKTAFVPTQSLDFSPLQNMESGTFGAKFPFSLPSDFGKILGVIQADPITPKFDASIPLSKVGYQDIPMEIDLEPYSNIAGVCKSGFVILFCIGLFFLTRRFMSPGG